MAKFEQTGVFKFTVKGSSFKYSKGGCPTVVLHLQHESGDGLFAYLYQFRKDAEVYNDDTKLSGYEQVQDALGWDGTEYDSFGTKRYDGMEVMAEVSENEYDGKISCKVTDIWNVTGNAPVRGLDPIDPNAVKQANAKLAFKKAVVQPVAAVAKRGRPSGNKNVQENPVSSDSSDVSESAVATAPKRTHKIVRKEDTTVVTTPTIELSKTAAWIDVSDPDTNGNKTESQVEDAWNQALDEVLGEKDEDTLGGLGWLPVKEKTLAILLKV